MAHSMVTRTLGEARISRIEEFSAPTHDPAFLLPEHTREGIDSELTWLAPDHYAPLTDKLIVSIQFWMVEIGDRVIVIDTGAGNFKERPGRFGMLNNPVLFSLAACDAAPERVTDVVLTHLHMDHVGWNTSLVDGRWDPTFPNARYHFPRLDYDWFRTEFDAGRNTEYGAFADSVLPIVEHGLTNFVEIGDEVAGCLVVEQAFGHTTGMVTYRLRSDGQEAIFSGDTLHSPLQIAHPEWNDTYAIDKPQARTSRFEVLTRAADRGALLLPVHFGAPYCGYVRRQGGGFTFEPASW